MKTTLTTILLLIALSMSAQTYRVTSYAYDLFDTENVSQINEPVYETTRFVFDFEYKELRINDLLLEIQEINKDEYIDYSVTCINIETDEYYIIGVDGLKKEISVYRSSRSNKLITYYF